MAPTAATSLSLFLFTMSCPAASDYGFAVMHANTIPSLAAAVWYKSFTCVVVVLSLQFQL
jgi:hypothetical protein